MVKKGTENSIGWKEISSPVHYVLEVAVWVIVFAALGKTTSVDGYFFQAKVMNAHILPARICMGNAT